LCHSLQIPKQRGALGQAGSEIGSIGRYRHKEGAPHNAVVNLGEQICEG
jgi:hypothetical protein